MKAEWILALLEGAGILWGVVKIVFLAGKVLQRLETVEKDQQDHASRLETVEGYLMNMGAARK